MNRSFGMSCCMSLAFGHFRVYQTLHHPAGGGGGGGLEEITSSSAVRGAVILLFGFSWVSTPPSRPGVPDAGHTQMPILNNRMKMQLCPMAK